MSRLAFEAVPRALDGNGDGVTGAKLYVYEAGTTTPVTTYSDSATTVAQAHPLISDAGGFFEQVYLASSGLFKVRITDADDVLISEADNVLQGGASGFADAATVLADTTLAYSGAGRLVEAGDFIATEDGLGVYEVQASGATDHHLTTAGGVKLKVVGKTWRAESFGVVADDDGTGGGTDNATAMTALADALAASIDQKVTFPTGYIATSALFTCESATMKNIEIDGQGCMIVYTIAATTNQLFFRLRNSAGTGENLSVHHLGLDLNRNPGNKTSVGGSGALSIGGFARMSACDNVIPSADNNGIEVNRNLDQSPPYKSCVISRNQIGGKLPVTGSTHSHGSLSDTGIWVTNYGEETVVSDNIVISTGDDAIGVVDTQSTANNSVAIFTGNTVKKCQGSAYKSGAARTVATGNHAELTRNDMYRIVDLAKQAGTTVPLSATITGGSGKSIGTATIADLGVDNETGVTHQCGIHLQDATGDIVIQGLHLDTVKNEAFKVTRSNRDISNVTIADCEFVNISTDDATNAVFRVNGDGASTCTKFDITRNIIRDTTARLLAYECSLISGNDGDFNMVGNKVIDCDFSSNAGAYEFAGSGLANLQNIVIDDIWQRCTNPTTRILDIHNGSPEGFEAYVTADGYRYTLPLKTGYMPVTNNPRLYGAGQPLVFSRDAASGAEICRLDSAYSWIIEVFMSDADGSRQLGYGKFWFSTAALPQGADSVTTITQTAGDVSWTPEVVLDSSTPQFSSGTDVVVQENGSATGGARAVVVATPISETTFPASVT